LEEKIKFEEKTEEKTNQYRGSKSLKGEIPVAA
jgi:hypothetical protein